MKKIKEFFNKIFSAIGNFFRFLGRKIVTFFRWLNDTTAVKKIKYGLGYVPNLIAGRLKNQTRKKIWGMIFLVPIVIGFVYFFLLR